MDCWIGVGLKLYLLSGMESKAAVSHPAYCPAKLPMVEVMSLGAGCWAASVAGKARRARARFTVHSLARGRSVVVAAGRFGSRLLRSGSAAIVLSLSARAV